MTFNGVIVLMLSFLLYRLRVRCRRKESSRSLSHPQMNFLFYIVFIKHAYSVLVTAMQNLLNVRRLFNIFFFDDDSRDSTTTVRRRVDVFSTTSYSYTKWHRLLLKWKNQSSSSTMICTNDIMFSLYELVFRLYEILIRTNDISNTF